MKDREISEKEALSILIQVYLSHTAKWYSALVALALGLLVIPLFALNSSLNDYSNFGFVLRMSFSVLTLLFLDAAFYVVSKVTYSLALLSEFYGRLRISGTEKTLDAYLIEVKTALRDKMKIFRVYKMRLSGGYEFWIVGSIIGFLVLGPILFYLVWFESDCLFIFVGSSAAVYFISLLILSRIVQIF